MKINAILLDLDNTISGNADHSDLNHKKQNWYG